MVIVMAREYRTQQGDVLDKICFDYYGREDVVEFVLESNPGLADQGVSLPAGLLIILPDVVEPEQSVVRLWD